MVTIISWSVYITYKLESVVKSMRLAKKENYLYACAQTKATLKI